MKEMKDIKRIVVKVGSSTITRDNGLNLRKIDQLAMVLSEMCIRDSFAAYAVNAAYSSA